MSCSMTGWNSGDSSLSACEGRQGQGAAQLVETAWALAQHGRVVHVGVKGASNPDKHPALHHVHLH